MGEIGAMVARLEQEGLDLDRLIDDELEAAGFLALCSRYRQQTLKTCIYRWFMVLY
jgi:hypothetical protein